MMERLLILCCLLSGMVGISNGALCLSNKACPYDQAWCIEDCSAVAVEQFNLTASHGNCKISSTIGGSNSDIIYGCHIGSCSTNQCVASRTEDTNEISCCCTENFCNTNFTVSPTTPTYHHIYSSFPSHTTPGQLVCEFYNCTDEANCVRGYEVCNESPILNNDNALVCVAALYKNITEMEVLFKGCFIDEHDPFNETCVLEEYPTNYYICVCNSTMCNSNGTLIPSNHTSTIAPTDATEPAPTRGNTDGIYSTYPQHVKPDELVCAYQNCTDEVCDTLYEVCSEKPEFKNMSGHFICYSLFIVELDTLNYRPSWTCFVDQFSNCPEECVPELYSYLDANTALFDCCCVGNLCNNVTFNSTVLPSTISSTAAKSNSGPYPTSTASTTSNNKSNYVPLIYGIATGVCLLIVLAVVVIVILAYCRTKTRRLTQSVSYDKLINS